MNTMSNKTKLQVLKEKAYQIDIDFHIIALDFKLTRVLVAMAATKETIASYRNYQAYKEEFDTNYFINRCTTRQVKVYVEETGKSPLSKMKAFVFNQYLKRKGLALDKEITLLFGILAKEELFNSITREKTEEQKEEFLLHMEERLDSIIENGY